MSLAMAEDDEWHSWASQMTSLAINSSSAYPGPIVRVIQVYAHNKE
jgi:hypothetical protein